MYSRDIRECFIYQQRSCRPRSQARVDLEFCSPLQPRRHLPCTQAQARGALFDFPTATVSTSPPISVSACERKPEETVDATLSLPRSSFIQTMWALDLASRWSPG
ncbi:hypothetical protein CVT26_000439 [Gymnopilus dilepis]|uniref:Uncharacterized protein n=1 Tax=Gymnopilus dilepis TaxID=231916 RepID=A0A409Y2B4_9AGAR|nr:hypothetical protein CVT26_000439 [Gymnopilus dilepis]